MFKIIFTIMVIAINYSAYAQKVVRIARITIDSTQLIQYKELLKKQMEAAIQKEPGVLSYEVFEDKTDPAKFTILEVYADHKAYLAHRETDHFKAYKSATKEMVKSLDLSEVDDLFSVKK
jgi:quinol monooxygenase YgiN